MVASFVGSDQNPGMTSRDLEICIIGAGMSGLLMGIQLEKAGFGNFRIFEKADSVGGTWRDNRYPGLTCDVPSFLYSYSFEPNPDWSHRFSPGPEIRAYFEGVADKYGLRRFITLDDEVKSARYVEGKWEIDTAKGDHMSADVLITATGALHQRHYPEIEGLESFEGAIFHSAAWQEDVPLEGKRIGVIGTGSTAVQMMEPLSKVASELTMFQRTPQWIMPVGNKAHSERERKLSRMFPLIGTLTRLLYKRSFEAFSVAVVEPGKLRQQIADRCKAHLATVKDPELRAKLTPDYEPGCKRLVLSRTFYPTLAKPNVQLEASGIERIEPAGVRTCDGKLVPLDVLVLATGFNAYAWGVDSVVGPSGQSLKEAWAAGTRSYYSIGMPGFPNFFMLVGPNSPIGNISLIDISEVQARYILRALRLLRNGKATAIAPREDATRAFHASLTKAMKDTVWVTGCNSWYLDADGVPVTWPWSAKRFHQDLRRPNWDDFELHAS